MNKKIPLLIAAALTLAGCHKTADDDGLQAHEQRALDLFETYVEKETSR